MKYWITPRLTPSLMRCLESEGGGERVCFKKMNGIIFMHVQAHLHRLDARMHALDRCVCRHIHAPNRFNCACTCIKFASMHGYGFQGACLEAEADATAAQRPR